VWARLPPACPPCLAPSRPHPPPPRLLSPVGQALWDWPGLPCRDGWGCSASFSGVPRKKAHPLCKKLTLLAQMHFRPPPTPRSPARIVILRCGVVRRAWWKRERRSSNPPAAFAWSTFSPFSLPRLFFRALNRSTLPIHSSRSTPAPGAGPTTGHSACSHTPWKKRGGGTRGGSLIRARPVRLTARPARAGRAAPARSRTASLSAGCTRPGIGRRYGKR